MSDMYMEMNIRIQAPENEIHDQRKTQWRLNEILV